MLASRRPAPLIPLIPFVLLVATCAGCSSSADDDPDPGTPVLASDAGLDGEGSDGPTADSSTADSSTADSSMDGDAIAPVTPGLPLGGLMYGNPTGGDNTANMPKVSHKASLRFRAEKTGEIAKLRWHNRTLSQGTIDDRCKSPDDVWCKCKDNGLDHYLCGYTTGNMYHVGNGGLTELTIQSDDGTAKHMPSGTVLARIVVPTAQQGGFGNSNAFVPVLTDAYVTFPLDATVQATAGTIYHIVMHNLRPPTACPKGSGYSLGEAKSCDRDRGSQGLNGVGVFSVPALHSGPFYGFMTVRKESASGSWTVYEGSTVLPWYVVEYADGDAFGNGYTFINSTNYVRHIGGSNQVRQRFTVTDADRTVNGFWFRIGRASSASAGDLTATLSGGSTDLNIVIPASSVSASKNIKDAVVNWVHVDLPQIVVLKEGTEYSLTFSSAASADYVANAGFDFGQMSSKNSWENSRAEYTTGAAWKSLRTDTWAGKEDLSLAFTIAGQPKLLQY